MKKALLSASLILVTLCTLALPSLGKDIWYLGHRISDISRPWTSDDYDSLLNALRDVDHIQQDALPRRGGEFTGPVYERIVSAENFRADLDIHTSVEVRRREAAKKLGFIKELMRVYFDFKSPYQPYGAEALGLMVYSVRQQSVLFTITVEYWLTLPENEQKAPETLRGLHEIKRAAGTLAKSSLQYLKLHSQFNEKVMNVYAYELNVMLPELFVHLQHPAKLDIRNRVESLSITHPGEKVRDAMSRLLGTLNQILTADSNNGQS